jgi:hypothetical protein
MEDGVVCRITSMPNFMNFRPAILQLLNAFRRIPGVMWLGLVSNEHAHRLWVTASSFHLANLSICLVDITVCKKLENVSLE